MGYDADVAIELHSYEMFSVSEGKIFSSVTTTTVLFYLLKHCAVGVSRHRLLFV